MRSKIQVLATKFRAVMEDTDFSDTSWLQNFPRNACDITSKLLGVYLFDMNQRGFSMVWATIDASRKHVWLENRGLVVDITADQFEFGIPPVVVEYLPAWHIGLEKFKTTEFDQTYYDINMGTDHKTFVYDMYNRISASLFR